MTQDKKNLATLASSQDISWLMTFTEYYYDAIVVHVENKQKNSSTFHSVYHFTVFYERLLGQCMERKRERNQRCMSIKGEL